MPASGQRDRPQVSPAADLAKLQGVRPADYLIRFALGAVVSIAAGVLGKVVGARFGGMFLAFPAILPASLTLVQEKEGTRRADCDAIGAVIGGAGLVVFAAIGERAFVDLDPLLGLLLALAGWVATSLALYALLALLRPEACDRAEPTGHSEASGDSEASGHGEACDRPEACDRAEPTDRPEACDRAEVCGHSEACDPTGD